MRNLCTLIIALLCTISAWAQETTSGIEGTITDSKGPLPGAIVLAIHQPTGTVYSTETRNDGNYNLTNLRIGGPYKIIALFTGMDSAVQENVSLVLGQEFTADFKMQETTTSLKEVTVTGKSQDKVFNSKRTGSEEIVTNAQLNRLPTVSRSLYDFTKLAPGASTPAGTNSVAFGGQSNQYNNYTLDGANFNNSFGLASTVGGQTNSAPISLDAVEQIQISQTPFDVRNGNFTGALVNTVTRSGTNDLKVSVYDYTKGAGLIGYNVGGTHIPLQTFNYNLVGASVGAPIIKNKLFIFVNYEQENRTDPGTSYVASTTSNPPNGTSVSKANFDTLTALSNFLQQKYGYNPGAFQGYSYRTQSQKMTARIDWNINSKNVLTFKYNYLASLRDLGASNSGSVNSNYGRTPGTYDMPFYGSGYTIHNNASIFLAELNTTFNDKFSNKFQAGYTQLRDYRNALSSKDFPLVDILDGNGNPYTSFGYEQYTYGNKLNTDIYQVNDILSYFAGAHEIVFGTQNSFKAYKNGFSPSYEGVYRFNSIDDFYAAAAGTKAAARYDLSYTLNSNGSFPLVGPKDQEYGFFAQDKWRVLNNLSITYGIRADIPVFSNTFLDNTVVDTMTKFANGVVLHTGEAPKTHIQVSPRVGFNWDPFGDHKTQVRGGVGLFSSPPPFVWFSNQASNSGVALFGSLSNAKNVYFSPNINAVRDTLTKTTPTNYSLNVTDPNFKFPQSLKSTIAVDRKLPWGIVVTGEYTYTKNINAAFFENVNLPATGVALNNGGDNRLRYASTNIYPNTTLPISLTNPNIGNAIYMTNVKDGGLVSMFTLQAQKNWRNKLFFSAAYTYMYATDVMVGGSTASTMWNSKPTTGNPNNPDVGLSNAYLPHRIIASGSYRIEYAKRFATQMGLIFEAAPSGVGSYTYQGDVNNDGGTSNDLMYIPRNSSEIMLEPSSSSDKRTVAQIWNDLNNFISQDKYLNSHRGQYAQRNALIYPWFKRVDLNVTEDINFYSNKHGRKHTLRLSADIYNFTNLINSNWGLYKQAYTTSPIKFDKMAADGKTPIFSFQPISSSFVNNTSIISRWQLQFGVRYLFD